MHLFTKLKTNFWILSQNVEKCFPLKGARDEADEPRRKPWESTSAADWPWIKPGENNEDNVESTTLTKNVFSANPWFRPEPDGRVWRAGERDFEEAGACRILPGHGQRQVDSLFCFSPCPPPPPPCHPQVGRPVVLVLAKQSCQP